MIAFKNILQESMGIDEQKEFFPYEFDPTKRNGGVWKELWKFPGNPDDYNSFLFDFIEHHWCPHQAFNDLNDGNKKIADAVSNAWWNGYMAGCEAGKRIKKEELKEHSINYIGKCTEIGENPDLPWSDATELAQDLGYYATFDDFEDPEDSNWMTISRYDFQEQNPGPIPKKKNLLFFRTKEEPIRYCMYDEDKDVHYFYE